MKGALRGMVIAASLALIGAGSVQIGEFQEPWKDRSKAIVIDPYEGNSIDWQKLALDKRIAGIVHRASSGFVADTLYAERKDEAKRRGYKWGSYHLAKSGNPTQQATFYLDTAKPEADEVMVLDIEGLDSARDISLDDARVFISQIREKTGRYPMVYGNHRVISAISTRFGKDELFSRTALWYARFKKSIADFPRGTWDTYTLWQFSCEINCDPAHLGSCSYLAPGTESDMDIDIYHGSVDEMRSRWPFSVPGLYQR